MIECLQRIILDEPRHDEEGEGIKGGRESKGQREFRSNASAALACRFGDLSEPQAISPLSTLGFKGAGWTSQAL